MRCRVCGKDHLAERIKHMRKINATEYRRKQIEKLIVNYLIQEIKMTHADDVILDGVSDITDSDMVVVKRKIAAELKKMIKKEVI
jgi:hypothetical protein